MSSSHLSRAFLMTWTLQGFWVSFTLAAALVVFTSQIQVPLEIFAIIGSLVWMLGFSVEVAADLQKNSFQE